MSKPADHLSYYDRCESSGQARLNHPHHSTCGRCRHPWATVTSKSITYRESRGMFALCQACWNELGTADRRTPYYLSVHAEWESEARCNGMADEDIPTEREVVDGVVAASVTLPHPKGVVA